MLDMGFEPGNCLLELMVLIVCYAAPLQHLVFIPEEGFYSFAIDWPGESREKVGSLK